jgi:hypothetical protein
VRGVQRVRCGAGMRRVRNARWLLSALAGVVLCALPVLAQTGTQNVEVEPVTCWWRTSTSSVRVGQPFSVVLTCSALETEATKASIDRGRLAPAAVQLPPFEVTGGTQTDDITTAARRFMQYDYTLRLIADDVFGGDVLIPALPVTYRIESKVQPDAAVQGREQTYILPPLPVHIAALVPRTETHIREAPVATVAAIGARQTRGSLLRTTGTIAFALAGLLLIVSLARAVQQRRSSVARVRTHVISDARILGSVRRELREVQQRAAREGWNDALAARALAALRVTGSYAAGQPVAQRVISSPAELDGQLVLRRWFGRSVLVSGAATASDIPQSDSSAITGLREALGHFTAARYGRSSNGNAPVDAVRDKPDLSDAIQDALRATDHVAAQHTWMAKSLAAAKRSAAGWRQRAWGR